ncbi:MAG: hypothetical protein MJ102_05170 [Clostridia bacterium]|nr:hypothetical protein [Clostridia bacterium]
MKYKTELHCHTREVSKCGKASAEQAVECYVAHGYTTLVLTNHLSRFTFNNRRFGDMSAHSWDIKISHFVNGYKRLRELAGDRLNVLLGCELRSNLNESDYQIYGVTEEFLRSMPDMYDMKISEISAAVRSAGLLLVQAHPFRNNMCVTDPSLLDGVEVFNGNLRHNNRNEITRMWAEKFDLIETSGGDNHSSTENSDCAGIITDEPITSNEQLLRILRSREYELIRYGDLPY